MAKTKIEWTATVLPDGASIPGFTFNPWIGCTKVATGCMNCCAEALAKRTGKAKWGPNGTRIKTSGPYWDQPHKWNDQAARDGFRRRVFCASLADVFEDWTGEVLSHRGAPIRIDSSGIWSDDSTYGGRLASFDDLRKDLFALIDETPNLDWLLVTKRPENIRRFWPFGEGEPTPIFPGCPGPLGQPQPCMVRKGRKNVWLLTSVATQKDADRNVPELLKCRDLSPVLGLSYEPAVGPIHAYRNADGTSTWSGVDWLIAGGESGPGARDCELRWIRSAVAQCKAAGVACFVKQLGARIAIPNDSFDQWPRGGDGLLWKTPRGPVHQGDLITVRTSDPKGGDWDEWPEDLRVRGVSTTERHRDMTHAEAFTMSSLIVAHCVGDYILQNDWMARNKKLRTLPCLVHVAIYTACVALIGSMPLPGLMITAISHFAQDRTTMINRWMWAVGQSEFAKPPLGPWSIIVVDNSFHLLQLWICWRFLAT